MPPRDWKIDDTQKSNRDPYSRKGEGLKQLVTVGGLKHIKRLESQVDALGNIGSGIKFLEILPEALLGAVDGVVHLDDPDVQEILQRIDSHKPEDVAMANRVAKLKKQQFPNAPFTELITYDWFTQAGIDFAYQVPLNGGRGTMYGQVLDFAAFTSGGTATAIAVQGNYWHSRPAVAASDALDMASGLGQLVNGRRIDKYLSVWERQIYKDRNSVLTYAMAGIELGP